MTESPEPDDDTEPEDIPEPDDPGLRRARWLLAVLAAAVAVLVVTWVVNINTHSTSSPTTQQPLSSPPATPLSSPQVIGVYSPTPTPSPTVWTECGLESAGPRRVCSEYGNSCDKAQLADLDGTLLQRMIEDAYEFDEAVITRECPKFLPTWQKAKTGFGEGTHLVPSEVQPGRYQTLAEKVTNCYWDRSRGGKTVANDFLVGAARVTVTIQKGDDAFTSHGCGVWIRA